MRRPAEWDTGFFGYPVGVLTLTSEEDVQQEVAAARQEGYRLLYAFIPPHDGPAGAAVEAAGGRLVDEKVTLGWSARCATSLAPVERAPAIVSGRGCAATSELEALAQASGEQSRFRLDPGFGDGAFERLYGLWLRNSLSGALARDVLLIDGPTGPVGLLTLRDSGERAVIGLLAVEQAVRGQGLGGHLLRAAQDLAVQWGKSALDVATQAANAGALRLYLSAGFVVQERVSVYHLWLDEAP